MSTPTLFVDRDGTLIEEPPDNQVDDLRKVRFLPGVFAALGELTRRGFRLVMVTNQDGLGTDRFPRAAFEACHEFVLEAFRSQGVVFDAIFICPHLESEACACRKPKIGLLEDYLRRHPFDPVCSAVIGDRGSDRALAANLGIRGFTVCRHGAPDQTWPSMLEALTARHATVVRQTKETRIDVRVNLDRDNPAQVFTGIGFFDHMLEQLSKHGGFALELTANGDLRVDEHHTVEDSALALGEALRQALRDKLGIARYGFVLPMDEAQAAIALDLSGRPFFQFEGSFPRETVGALPTELVPHFFRSLSETLKATLHVSVKGENTHHMVEACFKGVGRALRQAVTCEGRALPSTKGVL
jgi:imidazoleglycerol-phosphate dehydratase / histidinol-phosphatase